jgi:hypothetical protein
MFEIREYIVGTGPKILTPGGRRNRRRGAGVGSGREICALPPASRFGNEGGGFQGPFSQAWGRARSSSCRRAGEEVSDQVPLPPGGEAPWPPSAVFGRRAAVSAQRRPALAAPSLSRPASSGDGPGRPGCRRSTTWRDGRDAETAAERLQLEGPASHPTGDSPATRRHLPWLLRNPSFQASKAAAIA